MALAISTTEFTELEQQLMLWLPTSLSFAAIGERIGRTEQSVKAGAIALYRKLGVVRRQDAVARTAGFR